MLRYRALAPPPLKVKLHIHFTKSPKRDNIYKLCLWMLDKHNSKCQDTAPMLETINLLHCVESLESNHIKIFC